MTSAPTHDNHDVISEVLAQAKNVPTHDETGYSISDTYLGSHRPIQVLVIGFGAGGINIAHILGQNPNNSVTVQCYEKNPEVGGTWYENRYPGCACDIPIAVYQFSWHHKSDFSEYYASSQEILGYLKEVVEKHDLAKYAKLNHRVVGAWWLEGEGKWKIEVHPGDSDTTFFDYGEVLINASGVLNNWKWPAIEGVEEFSPRTHTANWDDSIDLTDKVVGVIGNGSSAVQVIPSIFPKVKKIKSFVRSSTWITAGFAQKYAGENGTNFKYSEEQKAEFAKHPSEYLKYQKLVEEELNQQFKLMINGTAEQKEALEFSQDEMTKKLGGKKELMDKMIPTNYAVGCRRPTPGNGYLEAITDEKKSEVHFKPITKITNKAIVTEDGEAHEIDVLVCATGFDVSFRPGYPLVGTKGDINQLWAEAPETYLSVTAPSLPNYFFINGPFGPYGHGSVLPIIEMQTRYLESLITKLQTQDVKSFVPKQAAVDDFKRHRELFLKRTAWNSPCRSWFKGGTVDGPIMMWPGSRLHFFEALQSVRFEDYDWEYRSNNRFSYFGNGFSQRELDGRDITWYVEGI